MNIANVQLRIARPTKDIERITQFYRDGLGLIVLSSFRDHDGFDGVMLGIEGGPYHLEFTVNTAHPVTPTPTEEDLLVFYLEDEDEWRQTVDRLISQGHDSVPAFNPYWDRKGRTFLDPDENRVVLQYAAWDRS